MAGALSDTYVAALQHDRADVPEDAVLLGVVRRPTPWFYAAVDENEPALAPPGPLLDDVKARHQAFMADGLADADAHNAALEAVDYEPRYLAHLDESAAARTAAEAVLARLDAGEDVALVCYENTEEKRCHRTILRERLDGRRGG